jgi:TfoX/Sxy family transcriptional regulator of competence genes
MNTTYSNQLTELLLGAFDGTANADLVEYKSVFGAVGGFVDDTIFITCGRFGVALRLPPDIRDQVFEHEGGSQLRYFPKGHIKKEYVVLPRAILDDEKRLRDLVLRSVNYVSEL